MCATTLSCLKVKSTPAEVAEFLNQVMGLKLSEEDIAVLESRTEGWIVGLQLAALSMQGREDIAAFLQAFTGSHRFILDYLIEEVFQRQPEHIRRFLLQTAILGQFCASLCNAVTDREDGEEILAILERSNLFTIPLDDQRHWYRYHHLFADVLQTYLRDAQSYRVADLHSRASIWYEQNGLRPNAIRHMLAAGDFEHAPDLIELVMPAMNLESGGHLGLTRVCGRAAPGQRVVEATPGYSGPHYTLVATLGWREVIAPWIFEGSMNGVAFEAYVRSQLLPALRPRDTLVMDKLSAHNGEAIRQLVEAKGARLEFLPPYSPDFNPIELCWSKVKAALRTAKARTLDTLVDAIAQALPSISFTDIQNWFAHCG